MVYNFTFDIYSTVCSLSQIESGKKYKCLGEYIIYEYSCMRVIPQMHLLQSYKYDSLWG